ncbi:MAG: flagellar biosynthesis protein FlhF [Gammaproteobacteria bacterium]|nr:MAG: flagellar biosynthesis protein FlhF [Gammaproteobacteria bacterium]
MIKKFYAATTRDALRQVRDALGANAIILSNRQVEGGVEIIAVADLDMAALTEQAEPALPIGRQRPPPQQPAVQRPEPARPAASSYDPRYDGASAYQAVQREVGYPAEERRPASRPAPRPEPQEPTLTSFTDYIAQREASVIRPAPGRRQPAQPAGDFHETPPAEATASSPRQARPAEASPAPAATAQAGQAAREMPPVMHELAREVRMLRALVEGQLAGFAWGDTTRREPQRAEVMKRLLAAGFSPALTRQILQKLPPEQNLEKSLKWVRAALAHNIRVTGPEADLVDRGGIYALVGPTGVGKTTTVAKLAARAVLKHGASKVAMITTDSYRIGAQDQLRIYGRILGSPVFVVRDENDLELTLLDLRDKHIVLIDTIGMSQRDRRVAEQISLFCGEGRDVQRLLLLGAPAQGITLEEIVRAYGGPGLAGCILTKIDEALSYGPVLDVVIRHQLQVHYVTNGQRVPEDLHLANAMYLVDRAFRLGDADPVFATEEEEYPVLMAAAEASSAAGNNVLGPQGAIGAAG